VFYPLLGLTCLTVAIASFIVLANPADIVRDRLIAHAKARLDRDLTVGGGASLTYFPFGVLLRDVELSASSDSPGPALVRAAVADVRVSLLSLLRQRLVVSGVTMTQPEINLSVDADGRRNWDFALSNFGSAKIPVRLAQLAPRLEFGKDLPTDWLKAPKPGNTGLDPETDIDVRVLDGMVRYSDARTGAAKHVTAVNLRVGLNGSARPTQMSGGFIWFGEPVSLEASVEGRDKASAHADIRLRSRALEAAYNGRLSLAGAMKLDGRLTANAPSSDALVRWAKGAELRMEPGAGAAIDGRVKLSGALLELADASITAFGTTATGSVSVDVSQPKPVVRADLKLAVLDFDRARAPSGAAGQPPLAPKAVADEARSIDDLLKRPDEEGTKAEGPVAQPHGHRSEVSQERTARPFDLSILRLADLDGRFDIGRLRWRDLEVAPLRLTATISDGKLVVNATDAHLYGGRGKAVLGVEPKGDGAAVSLDTTIDGVATQTLLKDLLGFDWLDGRGRLMLALSGEGVSEKQIVDGLQGRAEIKVAEGALVGWDLNQMLRGLRQGNLPATDRNRSARTSFGELTGSFAIADGVAQNEDLKVTGQAVNLSGSGSIVYRDRTINYTVRPKLAEAAGGLEDIEIPVRIYGAWDKPVLSPNLDGVLKDPRTAAKVQQLGRQLRSGNVDEALKSVLGDGPEAEKKAEKAKSFLKRFLKQ
jgi:AsmA protein